MSLIDGNDADIEKTAKDNIEKQTNASIKQEKKEEIINTFYEMLGGKQKRLSKKKIKRNTKNKMTDVNNQKIKPKKRTKRNSKK